MPPPRAALRLGFVGCGRVTESLHLPALRHLSEWQVIAASDTDAARLATTANTIWHSPLLFRLSSAARRRRRGRCRGVRAPTARTPRWLWQPSAARKHVFIEKPLALSLADCDQLVDAGATFSTQGDGGIQSPLAPAHQAGPRHDPARCVGRSRAHSHNVYRRRPPANRIYRMEKAGTGRRAR